MEKSIAVFRGKEIRKTLFDNEWWFVVEDVVLALIDSKDAKQYIQRMRQRDPELSKGWVQIVHTLSVPTDLELIFSMLGEAATTEITRVDDAQGFRDSKTAARKGGEVAGTARKDLERKTRKKVVSAENYLKISQKRQKQLKGKGN